MIKRENIDTTLPKVALNSIDSFNCSETPNARISFRNEAKIIKKKTKANINGMLKK